MIGQRRHLRNEYTPMFAKIERQEGKYYVLRVREKDKALGNETNPGKG